MREGDIHRSIMLAASERGDVLFRNNTGALPDKRGVPVKFGLCVGSSDLIGWHVDTVAIFHAVEVKVPGWKPSGKKERDRVASQRAFIRQVNDDGGIGLFASSVVEYAWKMDNFEWLDKHEPERLMSWE